MIIKIGICDDSQDARMLLYSSLEQIFEHNQTIMIQVKEFSEGERLLIWMKNHPSELDLVFLDIEMSGLNGMETARKLRELGDEVQIAFVTGYSDYVYDGYSVGALGYLLKPTKPDQLEQIVLRAVQNLEQNSPKIFTCHSGEIVYRIPHREILYFVSDRRVITCVTTVKSYTFYGKLNEVEKELVGAGYVRIHQSYLVRADAVSQTDGSEVLIGETVLPISRSCRTQVLLELTREMLK